MARARNLKPKFFTNDRLAELPPLVRLLFAGLWCIADREGRLEDRPNRIKVDVLPYDKCNVDKMLQDLHSHEFILRYTSGGTRYIQVLKFSKHQNPHVKESQSTIPAPDSAPDKPSAGNGASPVLSPENPERARLIPDSFNPIGKTVATPQISGSTCEPETSKPSGDRSPLKTKPQPGWHKSQDGLRAMGAYLGLPAKRGELEPEYRQRLFEADQAQQAAH